MAYKKISISRTKLKKSDFSHDNVEMLEEDVDGAPPEDFYQPAVELLYRMMLEGGETSE